MHFIIIYLFVNILPNNILATYVLLNKMVSLMGIIIPQIGYYKMYSDFPQVSELVFVIAILFMLPIFLPTIKTFGKPNFEIISTNFNKGIFCAVIYPIVIIALAGC